MDVVEVQHQSAGGWAKGEFMRILLILIDVVKVSASDDVYNRRENHPNVKNVAAKCGVFGKL
jgi:hypothetical protein